MEGKKKPEAKLPAYITEMLLLEVESQAELHGAGKIALAWEGAKAIWSAAGIQIIIGLRPTETWVVEDYMVKEIGEHHLEIKVNFFCDVGGLFQAEVYVPVTKAAKIAPSTIFGIESKNGLPERVIGCVRIAEEARKISGDVVHRAMDRCHLNCIF